MSPSTITASIAAAGVVGPRARTREPLGGAGGGDEHERLAQLARPEHARQLEHRRGARQLGQAGALERVAVREHDDPAARQARAGRRRRSRPRRRARASRGRPGPGCDRAGPSVSATRSASAASSAVPGRRSGNDARQLGERVAQRRAAAEGALAVERVGRQRRSSRAPGGRRARRRRRTARRAPGGRQPDIPERRASGHEGTSLTILDTRAIWPIAHHASCSSTTSSRSRRCCRSRCSATATRSCRPRTAARRSPASPSSSSISWCST